LFGLSLKNYMIIVDIDLSGFELPIDYI